MGSSRTTTTTQPSAWKSLPTRRELILLAIGWFTFTFSYLLSSTAHGQTLSLIPRIQRAVKGHISSLDSASFKTPDDIVYGSFEWLPGRVAKDTRGHGFPKRIEYYTEREVFVQWADRNKSMVVGGPKAIGDYQTWPYTSFWMGDEERDALWGSFSELGEGERAHEAFWRWGEEDDEDEDLPWLGPVSNIVKHVDGFTVIDNLYLYNGIVYIVTDEPLGSLPSLDMIVNADDGPHSHWEYISTDEAKNRLGLFAGMIRGTSWMVMDTVPNNATLLGLQKIYSSLSPQITCQDSSSPDEPICSPGTSLEKASMGSVSLPPPARLIHPNLPTFSDANPPPELENYPRRRRSATGYHPYTLKTAFPTLSGTLFKEDFDDYLQIGLKEEKRGEKPGWVFERVVVGCGSCAEGDLSQVFRMDAPRGWFDQPRATLTGYLGLGVAEVEIQSKQKIPGWALLAKRKKTTITVIASSSNVPGYEDLVKKLDRETRIGLTVLSAGSGWTEKMKALTTTKVLVSIGGGSLADAVWMPSGGVVIDAGDDETDKALVESLGSKYFSVGTVDEIDIEIERALGGL